MKSNMPSQVDSRQSDITEAMQTLAGVTENLQQTIEILGGRLAPIRRISLPTVVNTEQGKLGKGYVPLAENIITETEKIRQAKNGLQEILDTLEL